MDSAHTPDFSTHPEMPEPQLDIGSRARVLYGKHRDRRGRIVNSAWNSERQTWLYFIKSGLVNLGEYAADELWL